MNVDDTIIQKGNEWAAAGPDRSKASHTRSHFKEATEVSSLIKDVCEKFQQVSVSEARAKCETAVQILMEYQEQPGLLDRHMDDLVSPMMNRLSACARTDPSLTSFEPHVHFIGSLAYTLAIIRGPKALMKHFPHQAEDLEFVLSCLETMDEQNFKSWHTRYVLLLWLALLMLVPFDFFALDSHAKAGGALRAEGDGEGGQVAGPPALMVRTVELARRHLADSGRLRDAACALIAKLFTRPDVHRSGLPSQFFARCADAAVDVARGADTGGGGDGRTVSIYTGCLSATNEILKVASRDEMRMHLPVIYDFAVSDSALPVGLPRSALLRKLRVNCAGRMALGLLPLRLASWRYQRGSRRLMDNLEAAAAVAAAAATKETETGKEKDWAVKEGGAAGGDGEDDEEEEDVYAEVDEAVDVLLGALRDQSTVVRWAAAKALGRIGSRLPRRMGGELVGTALECLNFREQEGAWHGGCLAVGELVRRGLVLPDQLAEVVSHVRLALEFDVRRGSHNSGAGVRDAGCFVCWALARAYKPSDLKMFMEDLSHSLIQTALFDREVNCRRAAAAALQELVGRQGTVPLGIDLVTAADFFSLGPRANAFLQVAPKIAALGPYTQGLLVCLSHRKLSHGDKNVRLLAAASLRLLAPFDSEHAQKHILQQLLPKCTDAQLEVRHGAVMGVAALVDALGASVEEQTQTSVRNLIPSIEKARLYRGKGGEVMREAVCRLIESLAQAPDWTFKEGTARRYLQTVEEGLRYFVEEVQAAACDALRALSSRMTAEQGDACWAKFEAALTDPSEHLAARRGLLLAVGALPAVTLTRKLPEVAVLLSKEIRGCLASSVEQRDPQARRNAVVALTAVLSVVREGVDRGEVSAEEWNEAVLRWAAPGFLAGMGDYEADRRGDTGSWVRDVSMEACVFVLENLPPTPTLLSAPDAEGERKGEGEGGNPMKKFFEVFVGGVLQIAVEKLDRSRARACFLLQRLLTPVCESSDPPFRALWIYNRVFYQLPYGADRRSMAPRGLAALGALGGRGVGVGGGASTHQEKEKGFRNGFGRVALCLPSSFSSSASIWTNVVRSVERLAQSVGTSILSAAAEEELEEQERGEGQEWVEREREKEDQDEGMPKTNINGLTQEPQHADEKNSRSFAERVDSPSELKQRREKEKNGIVVRPLANCPSSASSTAETQQVSSLSAGFEDVKGGRETETVTETGPAGVEGGTVERLGTISGPLLNALSVFLIPWTKTEMTFPALLPLLKHKEFCRKMLFGGALAAGSLTESVSRTASSALSDFFRMASADEAKSAGGTLGGVGDKVRGEFWGLLRESLTTAASGRLRSSLECLPAGLRGAVQKSMPTDSVKDRTRGNTAGEAEGKTEGHSPVPSAPPPALEIPSLVQSLKREKGQQGGAETALGSRVVTPLLKTLKDLLESNHMRISLPSAWALLALLWAHTGKSGDVAKVKAGMAVLGAVMSHEICPAAGEEGEGKGANEDSEEGGYRKQQSEEAALGGISEFRRACFGFFLSLLGHRFPRVREKAADEIQIVCLSLDEETAEGLLDKSNRVGSGGGTEGQMETFQGKEEGGVSMPTSSPAETMEMGPGERLDSLSQLLSCTPWVSADASVLEESCREAFALAAIPEPPWLSLTTGGDGGGESGMKGGKLIFCLDPAFSFATCKEGAEMGGAAAKGGGTGGYADLVKELHY
uniref:Uncharacterized protein n=1 Tax=Chromera velia CCMP2878 TaxID=1169474 RepID=A0A0G4I9A1_9ALVE|eukprot:Cvel_2040.t1-p1 / transcript=Cvel_2040.t1 / gene=Cvel_2040 / organism=Chromera_velia_CCMP2878 / gene_product=Tubulin-specific chaperone D, putative / transcript_product=Tubulin-specific chaperone D, putative / location=Cvel_scaffold78:80854-93355(-) / protein_length=1695 / sequence_SO=supercontig / SO=protein_coding / is_pseudo=false